MKHTYTGLVSDTPQWHLLCAACHLRSESGSGQLIPQTRQRWPSNRLSVCNSSRLDGKMRDFWRHWVHWSPYYLCSGFCTLPASGRTR